MKTAAPENKKIAGIDPIFYLLCPFCLRDSAYAPCTFGTQLNGILQSFLGLRSGRKLFQRFLRILLLCTKGSIRLFLGNVNSFWRNLSRIKAESLVKSSSGDHHNSSTPSSVSKTICSSGSKNRTISFFKACSRPFSREPGQSWCGPLAGRRQRMKSGARLFPRTDRRCRYFHLTEGNQNLYGKAGKQGQGKNPDFPRCPEA